MAAGQRQGGGSLLPQKPVLSEGGGEEQRLGAQARGGQARQQGLRLTGGSCQGGERRLLGVLPQARGKRRCGGGHSAREDARFDTREVRLNTATGAVGPQGLQVEWGHRRQEGWGMGRGGHGKR